MQFQFVRVNDVTANSSPPSVKPDVEPDTGTDVLEEVKKRLSPFARLFGASVAVGAFLLFAGFLSDFAVYRLAGLPRLNLNYTALVESGAEVVVDTLALLVGSPARGLSLLLVFVVVLLVLSYRDRHPFKTLANSATAYQLARLACFFYAVLLLIGQINFSQRGLRPEDRTQAQISVALTEAYRRADGDIPEPRLRLRELERLDYEIPVFSFPNLAERWFEGVSVTASAEWPEKTGIALRQLPESSEAARHVFGWLVFSTALLLLAVVLLPGWQRHLDENRDDAGVILRVDARFVWLRRLAPRWQPALADPIRFLVAPPTLALCVLAVALLPIAHGLLARSSLGNEKVMIMLNEKVSAQPGSPDKSDKRENHCQNTKNREAMTMAEEAYRKSLRRVVQTRPTEAKYIAVENAFREALSDFADKAIAADCPLAAQTFWELRPPFSATQTTPDLADAYQMELGRILERYAVRFGILLSYPRDDQALTLIETIQLRRPDSAGQWSLSAHDREDVREVVVLPDTRNTRTRNVDEYRREITQNPDSNKKAPLLESADAAALEATLRLLENRYFYVSHAGVAVTALGGMAEANLNERPDLAFRAIDRLADLASSGDSAFWPHKSNDIRGAALTALHLTRSPYAAYRLAKELRRDKGASCTGQSVGIQCLGTDITAAGFLLSDLDAEANLFPNDKPAALAATRETLLRYLMDVIANANSADDSRSAACTAIGISSVRNLGDKSLAASYFAALKQMDPVRNITAMPVCINTLSLLGLDEEAHRQFLRSLYFLPEPTESGHEEPIAQVRKIAMITLSEMGLADEVDFLFRAYTESAVKVRDGLVARVLDEADADVLAGKFLDCAENEWRQNPERAQLCLKGLTYLKDHYDGDRGGTERVFALMQSASPPLRDSACTVLREFKQRRGLRAGRLFANDAALCP